MGLSPRPLQRRGSHSGRFYIAYYFYLFWALPKGRAFSSRFFLIYLLINPESKKKKSFNNASIPNANLPQSRELHSNFLLINFQTFISTDNDWYFPFGG
jgi:hypothetical protein